LSNGRQQSTERYDKYSGHHRGRRPEHVLKGVARELERAHSLLDKRQVTGLPVIINPGIQGDSSTPLDKSVKKHKQVEQSRYQGRIVKYEQT